MNKPKKGFVLWLTGLSGAGKTTIADALYDKLINKSYVNIEKLDGDIIREKLTKDLGFTKEDRQKNLERVSFVAKLLSRNNIGVIASFISPYKQDRQEIKKSTTNFIEVYIATPLEICEKRDVKGLYKKARTGKINNFTGISDPYEIPTNPDIEIKTQNQTIEESVNQLYNYLINNGYF
ncbi:adenylyl-sulfate kinase [Candidatus Vampirococcus lugosii]|uniref:Adenylyl-sulfate kinase n=1 Tax=Candidatus Vampirococcus lugosii TaxID=2789015 RepID=A0ABS5QKA1_9BACT|nr:adenylylsulfate kinase [Candidatus Vampirococcus lugosii]